jgi:Ala-tRNA(Pro) deacylase
VRITSGVTTKIQTYLDEAGISYRLLHHEAAASAEEYHGTLGTRLEEQAKSLLVRYKKPGEKGYAVVALPAQRKADMDQVKGLLGAREVRLANRAELTETTGCSFGELPPLGRLFGLALLFHQELLDVPEIYFNAGALDTSIAVKPSLLVELEKPALFS